MYYNSDRLYLASWNTATTEVNLRKASPQNQKINPPPSVVHKMSALP